MPETKEIAQAGPNHTNQPDTRHTGVDVDRLIDLYCIKGNTQEQCASILGCHRSTVRHHIKQQNLSPPQDDRHFESITTVKLKSKVAMMTDALTHDKAQKARVTELTTGIGTLLDKLAALQGKAGLIVHVITAQERTAEIEALDVAYKELSES